MNPRPRFAIFARTHLIDARELLKTRKRRRRTEETRRAILYVAKVRIAKAALAGGRLKIFRQPLVEPDRHVTKRRIEICVRRLMTDVDYQLLVVLHHQNARIFPMPNIERGSIQRRARKNVFDKILIRLTILENAQFNLLVRFGYLKIGREVVLQLDKLRLRRSRAESWTRKQRVPKPCSRAGIRSSSGKDRFRRQRSSQRVLWKSERGRVGAPEPSLRNFDRVRFSHAPPESPPARVPCRVCSKTPGSE